jgi:outer membrane receptor protein involved in Fe transport
MTWVCGNPSELSKAKAAAFGCLMAMFPAFGLADDLRPISSPTTATSSSSRPATTSTAKSSLEPISPELAKLKNLSLEDLMQVPVSTVTTASKAPEKAVDAPATVVVVTAQDIEFRGYKYLKDILRDLPGMETSENYFSEIGTQVSVRGISGNNLIVVLVNGMRVNPPGGEYFPFRSDFSVRDAEQVEVIYGPGSTLYGQDAVSAVINVKTKKPVEGRLGELGIDGGVYGERDAWFSFGKTFGANREVSVSGYFQYHDSDMTHVDHSYPAWWSDFANMSRAATPPDLGLHPFREDFGLNGFARVEGENWSIQYWHRESERSSAEGYSTGQPFSTNPASLSTPGLGPLKQGIWGDQSNVLEARLSIPFSDTFKLDSSVIYNHYQIEPGTRYIEAFFSPNPNNAASDLTHWNFSDFKEGSGTGITGEETLRWQVAPQLSLLAGVFAGNFGITPKSTDPLAGNSTEAQNYVYFTNPAGTGQPTLIPRVKSTSYNTYAGYLEAQWQITPQLKAIAGTRITGDTRLSEIPVTPRASVIYDLTRSITAKYIYTQAFVAPAPYFDATYDRGDILARTNGRLQSEKATSNEINLAYTKKNFNLGVSTYYGTQSNLILVSDGNLPANRLGTVYEALPGGTTLSPRGLVQSANGGSSHNYGFDLYGRANFGSVSPWASYSCMNFEQTLPGPGGTTMRTGLPGISRHNGRIGATWAVTRKLFVTPSLSIRSTPEHVMPGRLGRQLDTPYEVDLHVQYNITDDLRAFIDVRNLTNHKYALGDFVGAAYPQEGIHGVAGISLQF